MSTTEKSIAERFPTPDVSELAEAIRANRKEYRQLVGLMNLAQQAERLKPADEDATPKPARKGGKVAVAKTEKQEAGKGDEKAAE